MKKALLFIIISFFALSTPVYAEYYKVNVKRIDKDLYKDLNTGTFITTQYCYEYAYGEEAILKWEGQYGDNKIIFDGGSECDVKNVFK